MMHHLIMGFLVTLLSFSSVHANLPPIVRMDSTLTELPEGAAKVDSFLTFAGKVQYDSIDMSISWSQKALALAEELAFEAGILESHLKLGLFFYRKRNLEPSNAHFELAIPMAKAQKDDVRLAEAYHGKANNFFYDNKLKEGIFWLKASHALIPDLATNMKGRTRNIISIGYWYGQLGDFDTAFDYLFEALAIVNEQLLTGDKTILPWKPYLLTLISNTYMAKGDFPKALDYEERSLVSSGAYGDSMRMAISHHNICDIYCHLGNYARALEECKTIERQKLWISDLRAEGEYYMRLGLIYFQMEDPVKSLAAYEKGKGILETANDERGLHGWPADIAPLLVSEGKYDLAMEYLTEAMTELEELRDSVLLMRIKIAMGTVLEGKGQIAEAKKNYKEGLAFFFQTGDLYEIATTAKNLASLFSKNQQLDSALTYAEIALAHYEQTGIKLGMIEMFRLKYELQKEAGNLSEALAAHEAYFTYTDSLKTEDARRRFMEESVKQDVANLEAKRAAIERENTLLSTRNYLYLALAILAAIGLAAVLWFYIKMRQAKSDLAAQNLLLGSLNQTRNRFFGIIAHDLRSPITALTGVGMQMEYFLKKNDQSKLQNVAKMVDTTTKRLNTLLDNLLAWALSQTGSLPFEPKAINAQEMIEEAVAAFEPLAAVKNIALEVKVPREMEVVADARAFQTICRNLLSNALKYTPKGGQVKILASDSASAYRFEVTDTGTGISPEKADSLFSLESGSESGTEGEKGTGLGLVLCQELIQKHNGKITVQSEVGKGSTFSVFFPKLNPLELQP